MDKNVSYMLQCSVTIFFSCTMCACYICSIKPLKPSMHVSHLQKTIIEYENGESWRGFPMKKEHFSFYHSYVKWINPDQI